MAATIPQFVELHDAAEDRWVQYLVSYPKQTLEAIKAALVQSTAAMATSPSSVPAVVAPAVGELWTCGVCGSAKSSKAALVAHEVREHGVRRLTRKKVVDKVCPICCKVFGSRGQCLDHIEKQKSQICMVNLMLFHSDFEEGVVEEADRQQAELRPKR